MNITTMRRIDSIAGIPLCFTLAALEKVREVFRGNRPVMDRKNVRRVLVIKFIGLGAIAEDLPMFRVMQRHYPNAAVSFLTFSWSEELVRLIGFSDIRVIRTNSLFRFVFDTVSAVLWAWGKGFDVTHDLEYYSKFSRILSYLIHAPIRVGYFLPLLRHTGLLTMSVAPDSEGQYLEFSLAQIESGLLDVRMEDNKPPALPAVVEEEAANLLRQGGLFGAETLVAINVNTGEAAELRMWSLTYHSILATRLHSAYRASIAFVGTERDRASIDEVIQVLPAGVRSANLAGRTRVGTLLAILKRARLLVSNDPGPMHLASMMGIPTVGFFGEDRAQVFSPMGAPGSEKGRMVETRTGRALLNIKEITPEEAFDVLGRLLGKPREEGE